MKHQELSQKIIGCYYSVYNELGYGFLENVYHKAMLIELQHSGLTPTSEYLATIHYKGQTLGDFYLDIVVNDLIVVELKAVSLLTKDHEAQLVNYLNATEFEVGLLFNFGITPQFKRKIYDNEKKLYYSCNPIQNHQ